MKIEELYTNGELVPEKNELLTEKANSAQTKDQLCVENEQKKSFAHKGSKSTRPATDSKNSKRKVRISSGQKQRRPCSRMKLEQVNRHEEYSYLLEAETNQAILENIVCKDELCRYLTPLKFIEIDTWRRDVPYGTTEDQEENRRKWKTPLEILYGGVLKKEERNDQTVKPSKKIKRQIVQSAIQLKHRRKKMLQTAEEHAAADDAKGITTFEEINKKTGVVAPDPAEQESNNDVSAYKTREAWRRRPATSPERKAILNRVKNEKILSRHRVSTAAAFSKNGNLSTSYQIGRSYGTREALVTSGRLYNRSPLNSATSLSKTTSVTSPLNIKSLSQDNREKLVYQTQKFDYSQYHRQSRPNMQASISSVEHSLKPHLPFTRPRTRGNGMHDAKKTSRPLEEENVSNAVTKKSTEPHPPGSNTDEGFQRLSNCHLDPNIAYFPQSCKNSTTKIDFEKENACSTQLDAIGKHKASTSIRNKHVKISDSTLLNNAKKPIAVTEETLRLPRGSMFSSNHTTPRADEVFTPRLIPSELLTNRSWTSKISSSSSPWVTQALPDFSNKEVAARASREGYYVRKPSRTVSFRIPEADFDRGALPRHSRNDDTIVKKNISMVVVNVDEPCQTAKEILSQSSALNLPQKSGNFVGNSISVKCK